MTNKQATDSAAPGATGKAPDRAGSSPDTSAIFRLIVQVRQLLRGTWVATGLGLTVALYFGVLLVLAMLDLLVPLWPTMRLVALVLVIVPAGWALVTGVLRPLLRRLGNRYVARRIESHLPGIHNRLVSCVDLSTDVRRNGHSPEFYRRLVEEALARIQAFRPSAVVDRQNLRRAGLAAAGVLGVFLLAWMLLSDRLPTAMARIFSPFADIPPATGVEFTVRPGDAKVLRGDDIEFKVRVTKGKPRDLRLELRPDDGSPAIRHELQERNNNRWTRTLRGMEHSFSYRVHGGGTWSKLHHVTMVDRPRILELQTVVRYPEYMGIPEPRVNPRQTADVTGPEQSDVEVRVNVEGQVASGQVQLLEARVEQTPLGQREERVWFTEKLPEGAVVEGNWQWDNEQHAKPVHGEPPADGVHGHLFHSATVGFQVQPGEYLFAYVYLVPEHLPETVMLQWHDGQSWEHRAYWGNDKIDVGQADTPSRLRWGALPPAGEWVRLEVPARAVDLEGRAVRGMSFTTSGGQCWWHLAGSLPPATREERRLAVVKTFDMQSEKKGLWSGHFTLAGEGLYRVEVKNELGHPNQTMKEAKYVAIPDNPPQVTVERPGGDVTLSEPRSVPLVVAAYDDFALKDVKLLVQRGESGGFRETAVRRYEKPTRGDTLLMSLDLAGYKLQAGEHVVYRVQVQDRKEQIAQSPDYFVRIAADDNAADRQLARFEQAQDTFQERLVQLIGEQAKVRDKVEQMEAQYAPLEEKIREAQAKAEARRTPEGQPQAPPALELDPESTQQLAALRQELGQVAAQEEQNAALGQQLSSELTQAAEQSAQLQMLPPELIDELRAAQEAFQQMAAQPMQELTNQLKQAAAGNQADPKLGDLSQFSDRLQQELEAMAERLKALDRARERMDTGLEEALAQLEQELEQQQAGEAARGLDDLKDMIAALREQLEQFEHEQEELLDATDVVPERLLDEVEEQQQQLEIESEPPLAEARRLLEPDQLARMRRDPRFPDAPLTGDPEEYLVPPAEEDTEPTPEELAAQEAAEKDEAKPEDEAGDEEMEEEEEPLFEPALGGPRPKLDPRFADKRRPLPPKQGEPDELDPSQQRREELASRQFQRLEELNLSRQSLASDQQTLEAMLQRLEQAMANGELPRDLMRSPEMQQAMDMAARVRQLEAALAQARQAQAAPGQPPDQTQTPPRGRAFGMARRTTSRGTLVDAELARLDPGTRTVILKMQPKLREELLQGMREQGPEGYRKFIEDYFKRLAAVKSPSP